MKNLIIAAMLAVICVGPAQAYTGEKAKEAAFLDRVPLGGYCTRQYLHPHKEVFRIGISRANYKPQANDCEVLWAGDQKRILECQVMRCDLTLATQ